MHMSYSMCMATLERRVQLLLDPDRYEALQREARTTHRSVAAVIRESIDERLDRGGRAREAAVQRLLELADRNKDEAPLEWDDTVDELERTLTDTLR